MKHYKSTKFNNGLTIITCEDENSEVVDFNVCIKAGARYEEAGESGYAHVLEHMLLRGTHSRPTAMDISLITDRAGAYLNAQTNMDRVSVVLEVAKERRRDMFTLLADVISDPLFNADTLENEKKVIIQEIGKIKDDIAKNLWNVAIPKILSGHPIGKSVLGDEKSVTSVTTDKLRDYYRRRFQPLNMAIIGVGAISHQELCDMAAESVKWNSRADQAVSKEYHGDPVLHARSIFEKKAGSIQTLVDFLFIARPLDLKEALTMNVIGTFLSYGHSSLLYQELRHKLGIVYSPAAYKAQYLDAYIFYPQVLTSEPKMAISTVTQKLFDIDKCLSNNLLEEIKDQQGNIMMRKLSDPYSLADFLATNWYVYGKMISPVDVGEVLNGVNHDDVLGVGKTVLNKDHLAIAVSGESPLETA